MSNYTRKRDEQMNNRQKQKQRQKQRQKQKQKQKQNKTMLLWTYVNCVKPEPMRFPLLSSQPSNRLRFIRESRINR